MPPPLSLGESTPLANQVAGHEGVMSDASGSLVIKPALAREIAFYQTLNSSTREDSIRRLKPFVPKFFGTLRLEGQLSSKGDVERLQGKDEVPESVVIENLSYAFIHPNILDVKLGTVLYDPDASEEKKARMDKQARETTTHETGVRLTGCQIWHAPTQSYIITPKSFGKSISAAQLHEGMIRFFPLPNDTIPSLVVPPSPAPTSGTSAGSGDAPLPVVPEGTSVSIDNTIPPTPITASNSDLLNKKEEYKDHAIPPESLIRIFNIIIEEIDKLVAILTELEIRFVGGSLLIVYEGDSEKLSSSLERYEKRRAIKALKENNPDDGEGKKKGRSAFSDDGSVNSNSDSDSELGDSEDEDLDEDHIREEEDEDEDRKLIERCPPVRIKLIDFAHTWLAQGEGPDLGVLKGLNTLRGLIEGRRKEVEDALNRGI